MSNELTLFKSGLPTFLKGVTDNITAALAGGNNTGSRRISIKGGVFREIVGGKEYRVSEERAMNVIIINAAPKVSRTYYSGTYVEGETVAPTCWSADSERPDPSVKNKQCDNCLKCPHNVKGSGPNDGRACRFSQRLAVLLEGEVEKEQVYQLTLPGKSIFGGDDSKKMPLKAYARYLNDNGAPIFSVVTEMRFDTASPIPKLIFKALRPITEDEYEVIQRTMNSPDAINAITMTVAQTDGVQSQKALEEEFAASPAPKAIENKVVEEEPVEEPKKAVNKKAPVVNESKLEDLVGEWDDA